MGWPSHGQPADKVAVLNQHDSFSTLRNRLGQIAEVREQWAGIPIPIEDARLVIEPRYAELAALKTVESAIHKEPEEDDHKVKLRNVFYSTKWKCDIYVWEEDGKIHHGKVPKVHHLSYDMMTMGCSVVWGIEQEHRALKLLGTLIPHHAFKKYLLTGMFLETSKRSRLTYLFRKLKPTVVIDARSKSSDESARILCALCMHPIAYYGGSWAGAMCPTDDVIAHLMLMRADEPMLWRRANQHAPDRPEAGL